MKELGPSNGMMNRKNVQDRPAKETRKTGEDAKPEQTTRKASDVQPKKTPHFTPNGVFQSSKEISACAKGSSDQDAKPEQPSPESSGVWQQLAQYARDGANLLGKAVVYTTLATAVVDSTVRPASAKSPSRGRNDRYAPSVRDDHDTQPSRWSASPYPLEPRGRWSSNVEPYMGREHGEFSQMVRIGDREFVRPTAEDIKALLQDEKFPEYLKMMCKKPQAFTDLLKNEVFLDMISPMYQDENVHNFMQSLCKNPGLQADFLKLKEVVSNNLIEKRMDALFKHMGATMFEHMDAIRNRLGNDDEYDKKRETDHLTIQKNQQYQEYETVLMQMISSMQGLTHKVLDQQHEKDKMRMSQDAREKERFFDSGERERERSRKTDEQYGKLVLGATATILGVYFIAKCMRQHSEEQQRIAYLRAQMVREELDYRLQGLQEQRQFRYRQDPHQIEYRREEQQSNYRQGNPQIVSYEQSYQIIQGNEQPLQHSQREEKRPQIEYRSEDRLKIEEIEEEGSKTRSSYGQGKREYSEQDLVKRSRVNHNILDNKELLLNLLKSDNNENIMHLFYDCGGLKVMEKIFEFDKKKDKEHILQNKQVQKSLLNSKSTLDGLLSNEKDLKRIAKYGGEELKRKFGDAIVNRANRKK